MTKFSTWLLVKLLTWSVVKAPTCDVLKVLKLAPNQADSLQKIPFAQLSAAGNQVAFVYAFPSAETYAVWVQLMIEGTIITLPVQITVMP